jgi:hypothetical protein
MSEPNRSDNDLLKRRDNREKGSGANLLGNKTVQITGTVGQIL